jgi:hypothetical protein
MCCLEGSRRMKRMRRCSVEALQTLIDDQFCFLEVRLDRVEIAN